VKSFLLLRNQTFNSCLRREDNYERTSLVVRSPGFVSMDTSEFASIAKAVWQCYNHQKLAAAIWRYQE